MNETITASAPGRVGIVGNPTDMYGGSVISCSTKERARVCIQPADRLVLDAGTEQRVITSPDGLAPCEDIFDIARVALAGTESADLRVRISWSTDIPFRAGLSGSTALLVSMVAGLLAFRGIRHSPYHLAELVRRTEYQNLTFCGYQDAYMCTFGGLHYMDFRGKEFHLEYGTDPFATMESMAPAASLPLVVVITGGQRVSGGVHTPLRERWLAGETEVVEAYNAIAVLAREGKKAILDNRLDALGKLMNENQAITHSLGGSNPEDDRFIELARRAGASGAKLAGSSGAIVALHDTPDELARVMMDAGAAGILEPSPGPGLDIEPEDL
ncbi:MAG: hypothetical protein OXH02_03680 [Gemmatimonadetes bacterium]|nr:hypothetical protein [Gemmatimonadota bacterium]